MIPNSLSPSYYVEVSTTLNFSNSTIILFSFLCAFGSTFEINKAKIDITPPGKKVSMAK